jgi:hypothetical protein
MRDSVTVSIGELTMGDAQPNVPHQRCADIDLVGQHLGVVGQQQHIVETQRFGQHLHPERLLWRSIVPD